MTMPTIAISVNQPTLGAERVLSVHCPYHPELVAVFRNLNGRFQGVTWHFDHRDERLVREALIDVFGTDDSASCADTVDLRLHVMGELSAYAGAVFLAGRQIARATGRDSGAKLGPGVVVVQGPRPHSGGSMKNWKTVIPADSVLEVRDIPRRAADKLLADPPGELTVSVVGAASPDLDALERRRDQLREELAEVERMIAGHTN